MPSATSISLGDQMGVLSLIALFAPIEVGKLNRAGKAIADQAFRQIVETYLESPSIRQSLPWFAVELIPPDRRIVSAIIRNVLWPVGTEYTGWLTALNSSYLESILIKRKISEKKRGLEMEAGAANGDLQLVQALFASGPTTDQQQGRALQTAAANGHLRVVERLLLLLSIHGISTQFIEGAVEPAAANGHLEVLQALLENQTISKQCRGAAVLRAAQNGHLEIVALLLANGKISFGDKRRAQAAAKEHNHQAIATLLTTEWKRVANTALKLFQRH